MKFSEAVPVLKETYTDWNNDKAPRLAAALAYYTIFSIAPLLLVVLAIAGLIFGKEAAEGQIIGQIQQTVGETSAKAIQEMLANARHPSQGTLATIIGAVTLLLGAGGVFGALQDALNTIWGVTPKPDAGYMKMIKDRFLSFTMVLGLGFLLIVSLVISAVLSAITKFVGNAVPGAPWLWETLNTVVSLGVFTTLFAMMFKILPDAKIKWSDVGVGAFLTAIMFTLGKFGIGIYLGRGSVGSAYGAAGSLVVLLLWIYYSAQILFFGAEFTKVYAKRHGSKIEPVPGAVPVSRETRADQGLPAPPSGATSQSQSGNRKPAPRMRPARTTHAIHSDSTVRTATFIGIAIGLVAGILKKPHPS
jgi:membrane protein